MALSIIERILGTNDPYTTNYYNATLRLTRSMTIKTVLEAETYNKYVESEYGRVVDQYSPETWRYFKHLAGQYHEVDKPMKVISRDNRKEIVLTRETMKQHIQTRDELNMYGQFYEEVIKDYPEQTLLLRSILATNEIGTIEDIIYKKKEWEIVGYNTDLVEQRETDLIHVLQQRIYNHSHTGLIAHYRHSSDLFLAMSMSRLYTFIYENLLVIRIRNIKTSRVHSYHMLNYFASFHAIDVAYDALDDYQRLYLYRNLTYLNSHAGKNKVFEDLVDVLMTRKRISVVNYVYKQSNELKFNFATDYAYYQELLNKEKFVYDRAPYDYEALANKEILIQPKNEKEYRFNGNDIDYRATNTLTTFAKTKDLEINLQDDTNNVKYKLIDALYDYWAATIELGYNQALVEFVDPVSGKEFELVAKDAFKLFTVALHFSIGSKIETIPDYWCWNIVKEVLPTEEEMMSKVSKHTYHMKDELKHILSVTPKYMHIDTNRSFRSFVETMYRYELGMWIYTASTGNIQSKNNIMEAYETMHQKLICSNDNENVQSFLVRIGLTDLLEYSQEQAMDLVTLVIKMSTEDIMELAEINKMTQEAATYVIHKFNSFTTQLLSIYNSNDVTLVPIESPRYTLDGSDEQSTYPIDTPKEILCFKHEYETEARIEEDVTMEVKTEVGSSLYIVDTTQVTTIHEEEFQCTVENRMSICGSMETYPHVEITADMIVNLINVEEDK